MCLTDKNSEPRFLRFKLGPLSCRTTIPLLMSLMLPVLAPSVRAQPPGPITYYVNQTVGSGSLTGDIVTDGTLGTLSANNIVDWNLLLNAGSGATYQLTGPSLLSGGNSGLSPGVVVGLSATSTQLLFNFSATQDAFGITTFTTDYRVCYSPLTCIVGDSGSGVSLLVSVLSGGPVARVQFTSLSGTQPIAAAAQTATLVNLPGGSSSAPAPLSAGQPIAQLAASIGGQESQAYYSFYWSGGAFVATASITGSPNAGASYLFSEGAVGNCNNGGTATLNGDDSFASSITIVGLPAGEYCIGLSANSSNDQSFTMTFNTPVQGVTFFSGAVSVGAPWYYLQLPGGSLFGYYVFLQGSASTANAFFYHADLGYEYAQPGASAGSAYFYDFASSHWWYSSSSLFPCIYDFTLGDWLYYFPNTESPGHYTTNPRYFSNLTTEQIFTM
jgi:hypothetical protein